MSPKEIKEARRLLRKTQTEIAEILNVSLGSVQMWESGKRNISPNTAKILTNYVSEYKKSSGEYQSSSDLTSVNEANSQYSDGLISELHDLINGLKGDSDDIRWSRIDLLVKELGQDLKSKIEKLELIQKVAG